METTHAVEVLDQGDLIHRTGYGSLADALIAAKDFFEEGRGNHVRVIDLANDDCVVEHMV